MQFPISIGLHRSRFLDISLSLVATLASASIIGFVTERFAQMALLGTICVIAFLTQKSLTPRVQAIRLERGGAVSVKRAGEAEFTRVALEPPLTVHPWLTVIRLRSESGIRSTVLIAADSLSSEDFRRLRIFIRWQKMGGAPADDA